MPHHSSGCITAAGLWATLLLFGLLPAGRAGSVTGESVWDRSNAIQRAQSQLPAGATVTRTTCTEVNVRTGNYRYICTLEYPDPPRTMPAPGNAPAVSPSGANAPAP